MKEQEATNSYYPTFLYPYAQTLQTELAIAYSSSFQEVKTTWISPSDIDTSLQDFVERINSNGLDEFMNRFSKSGEGFSEEFLLHATSDYHSTTIGKRGDGLFYLDGHHTLALGYLRQVRKQVNPLWIAVASFSSSVDLHNYAKKLTDKEETISIAPVILQIQGPTEDSYNRLVKYQSAKKILRRLKWERALVIMLLQWAENTGIPLVYLLPSSLNNYWVWVGEEEIYLKQRNPRLYMRYDVTAKRMGFNFDEQSGLFWVDTLNYVDTLGVD